ncbi:MAG: SMC-Scp complex subunit ScpB [Corallococcus sp.]|nr:SMC-Scp complex subunit ScpB [Corallococcus sp.]MCM1359690.1 SMC-Scp complex subunit ScpB [Corallococcus sp.]MCM1395399.1 SMC-Scp complex subunit ScpB [Corallococcus sp.]
MSRLSNVIQSILFLSGKAVEEKFIKEKLQVSDKEFRAAVSELMADFGGENGIHLLRFNGKLQFATNPEYSKEVESVLNPIKEKELTNAMLETLAIIAYKQPVTRLEVEEVRAVDCTYSIQNLTRLGMIEAVGHKETIGKPLLFATTDDFLKRFSIGDVTELPDYETLLAKLKEISYENTAVKTVEKPMFDKVEEEQVPEFLQNEEVEVVE